MINIKSIVRVWGLLGIILIFALAITRLSPSIIVLFDQQLHLVHWIFGIIYLSIMVVIKGYLVLQLRFAKKVLNRLSLLEARGSKVERVLAPFFCMSFFHAPRRQMFVSYFIIIFIVILAVFSKKIPIIFRGIIDLGVSLALIWGIISLFYYGFIKKNKKKQ